MCNRRVPAEGGARLGLGVCRDTSRGLEGHWRSRWRVAIAALLALAIGMRIAPAVAHSTIRGLHLAASARAAALSVELSHKATYRLYRLAHPDRVVLDLRDVAIIGGVLLPGARGVVTAIRDGRRPHGVLRFVLQLRSARRIHVYWAHAGRTRRRLVVLIGRASALPHPRAVRSVRRAVRWGRDIVVAVDPGHGGKDPGAIGPGGLEEKTVTLKIGRDLAHRIDEQRGMRAVLTRDRDVYLTLEDRLRIARAAKADLFVSIHADSVDDPHVSGASVYILSLHGATDVAAHWLAERENAADLRGGVSLAGKSRRLDSVLLNLSQSASISSSMKAAKDVLGSLERSVPVCKRRVEQAAFVVLKSPDIPSMLVETAYISNRADERRLRSRRGEIRIADAIFRGIRAYFERHPPTGTLLAEQREARSREVLAGAQSGPGTSIPH